LAIITQKQLSAGFSQNENRPAITLSFKTKANTHTNLATTPNDESVLLDWSASPESDDY